MRRQLFEDLLLGKDLDGWDPVQIVEASARSHENATVGWST